MSFGSDPATRTSIQYAALQQIRTRSENLSIYLSIDSQSRPCEDAGMDDVLEQLRADVFEAFSPGSQRNVWFSWLAELVTDSIWPDGVAEPLIVHGLIRTGACARLFSNDPKRRILKGY